MEAGFEGADDFGVLGGDFVVGEGAVGVAVDGTAVEVAGTAVAVGELPVRGDQAFRYGPLPVCAFCRRRGALPGGASRVRDACLPGRFHHDPADRMIVATARETGATLLTRDRRILRYGARGHLKVMKA